MRVLQAALMGLALVCAPSHALAQSAPTIVTVNPSQYAESAVLMMSRRGVGALREIYAELFGAALPTNVESALIAYDRAIGSNTAAIGRIVETTSLADSLRSIYAYHYFGGNAWIFTRYDFVKISDNEWALSTVAFSSEWSGVALQTTPSFSSR